MKISVVTISYNQARFLQECIDSVAGQAGDWEHIIVDPGSTDGSREIIEANRAHFSHIVFEQDNGPADGLNKGFALATGTHGFFINSDDFILPQAFDAFADLTEANPSSDIILCGGWVVDADGNPIRRVKPTQASLEGLLNGSSTMFQQGMLFSMPAYRSVGGFNIKNRICWDFELLCDLMGSGCQVVRSSHRVGAFRVYSGAISDPTSNAYNAKLEVEVDRISRKVTGRALTAGYANAIARVKRYVFNPWLLREGAERKLMPRHLARLWNGDKTRETMHGGGRLARRS